MKCIHKSQASLLDAAEALRLEATAIVEKMRQRTLNQLNILDTAPELIFNDTLSLLSNASDFPTAVLSFIDTDRIFVKGSHNYYGPTSEPLDNAFCSVSINDPNEVTFVENSKKDDRFSWKSFSKDGSVISYVGRKVFASNGVPVGVVCIFDDKKRKIDEKQTSSITNAARIISHVLETRNPTIV